MCAALSVTSILITYFWCIFSLDVFPPPFFAHAFSFARGMHLLKGRQVNTPLMSLAIVTSRTDV